jgi:hypothetical protein
MPPSEYSSRQFLLDDQPGTLFPLRTSTVLAEHAFDRILEYVYQRVLREEDTEHRFLSQLRCYSSKHGFHCRRTMRLDPVAEHFIYDLVYRNRHTLAGIILLLGEAMDIASREVDQLVSRLVIRHSGLPWRKPGRDTASARNATLLLTSILSITTIWSAGLTVRVEAQRTLRLSGNFYGKSTLVVLSIVFRTGFTRQKLLALSL